MTAETSASTPVKRGRGRPKGSKGHKRVLKAPKDELIEAIESKVTREPNGCWIYQGTPTATGHATLYYNGAIQGSAHRVAYEVFIGDIPKKGYVLQKCHNKMCVAPDHLYLAGYDEVVRLRAEAGKSIRGSRNPKAKLTRDQALEIRRRALAGELLKDLTVEFGVGQSTISQIKNNILWREDDS